MTDYIGLIQGRRATTDAILGQVLSWLNDVQPGTANLSGHGDHIDAWRHGGTAALLAYHHGYDNVKRWGDALEDYKPDNEQESRQDAWNNEVGAKIGALARITGMTVDELGDAVKAAFKAGAFQPDAYAPYSRNATFRVGDMTLSPDSGVVTLRDGSRFDLTKSAILSADGVEYPLLHVMRRDGGTQNNWTNMEDSRTLFRSGIGKWDPPPEATLPNSPMMSSPTGPVVTQPVPFPDVAQQAQRLTTDHYFRNFAPAPGTGSGPVPLASQPNDATGSIPYVGLTNAAQRLFANVPPSDFPASPSWASPNPTNAADSHPLNARPVAPLPEKRSAAPGNSSWASAPQTNKEFRYLARVDAGNPQAAVFDAGAPAVPFVRSDDPDDQKAIGGLPGLLAAVLARRST
ncbi:hypothetical protein JQ604_30735 [Bradyrhizobium jicamae]|uniref:hypothetical protein n=1 Tax=Bradyrhizobium jicamae TaxID=280332 RepID=UPI001BAC4D73|nr:hypothetical protein [Bradyrhizobium jicamae]MBR0756577.1 hypothetical protein [Bradyrhizobium jicamae]